MDIDGNGKTTCTRICTGYESYYFDEIEWHFDSSGFIACNIFVLPQNHENLGETFILLEAQEHYCYHALSVLSSLTFYNDDFFSITIEQIL